MAIQGRAFQAKRTAGLKALRQAASLAASQNNKEADTAGEAGEVRSPRLAEESSPGLPQSLSSYLFAIMWHTDGVSH